MPMQTAQHVIVYRGNKPYRMRLPTRARLRNKHFRPGFRRYGFMYLRELPPR